MERREYPVALSDLIMCERDLERASELLALLVGPTPDVAGRVAMNAGATVEAAWRRLVKGVTGQDSARQANVQTAVRSGAGNQLNKECQG
jgi:hypothetical protein